MYRVYAKKKLVNTSSFFQRPSWNFSSDCCVIVHIF